MRFSWLLTVCMGAIVNASNVLEVDLVFPRNETYAPTEEFPVVFALQNAERAQFLDFYISYDIWNRSNMRGNDSASWRHDMGQTNWSDHDPYFVYTFFKNKFNTEGRWLLVWTMHWESCDEETFRRVPRDMIYNESTFSVPFTIKNSAPKVDLVAATANKTCPGELGLAINVTNQTMRVPADVEWEGGETCAVVASSTPTPTTDPCRVKIDSNIAESMSASWKAQFCKGISPPSYCPKDEKSTAQQLIVLGVSCVLAALGAIGFILM